jgi:RNA polymerase sigma factor (sigma-70 family)
MVTGDNLSDKGKRDLVLVEQALNGNQIAYGDLMERYRESIYFMMLKMVRSEDDAEDLTIEAFGKAFNRLHQYSPSFAFSTWLFKIASNNAIDHIRKKRIQVTSIDSGYTNDDGDSVSIDVRSGEKDPEEERIHDEKVKMMRGLVKKLKPRYRDLIEKRYFEELSYEEIAEQMSLPLGTVKAQLFRARTFLAEMMGESKDTI